MALVQGATIRNCRECGERFVPTWEEVYATITEQTPLVEADQRPFTVADALNMIDVCPLCIPLGVYRTRLEQAEAFAALQWAARKEQDG